ncbi:734_t:CDS:2, partial [Gigaspora margarita]
MEVDVLKGCTFNTFDKVRAAIEGYIAKTNTNLILGKTTKYPDGSGYRQAYFFCEKQEKYINTVAHKFDQSDLDFTEKLQLPNNKQCSKKNKFMQELDQDNKISHLPSTNDKNVDLCDPKDDGYDVSRLNEVLSYMKSGIASQKYWFYSPECAQLASDTFNVPNIVLAAE